VADFNQFGSKRTGGPGAPSNPEQCAQCEAMLPDALDGTLSAADQATFDLHLVGCPNCATMLADAQRGAAWMEMLKSPRPEPAPALLERILAQTSNKTTIVLGPTDYLRAPVPRTPNTLLGQPTLIPSPLQPTFASSNVIPFRTRITHGFRSLGHTMLQPRLAMTAAMAFFSIALTLNLTGVRLTDLRANDFKPSSIVRSYHSATAKVISYSYNLRVVYELESRVRDLQRSSDDDGSTNRPPSNAPAAQQPSGSQQPADQSPDGKPAPQKQDKKQTKPNPGSSRRETPSGSIQLAEFAGPQAPSPFAPQAFVVHNPSVIKQEGGSV
jgi:Putative zinc-finger